MPRPILSCHWLTAFACLLMLAAAARAQTGSESSVGYIDSAIPRTTVRLRYDTSYQDNRPDRAEFLYPKFGAYQDAPPPLTDPHAAGPEKAETNLNFQTLSAYFEWALGSRLSIFVELPMEWVALQQNPNASGMGDMNAGFKFALLADDDRYVTLQLRAYMPTGDGSKGLGTDHNSLEPALLVYQRFNEHWVVEGELRDWAALDGSDFAGNILRYGIGVSYHLRPCEGVGIAPVAEFVGWTIAAGKQSANATTTPIDAAGDTIFNAKLGVRVYVGEHSDFYAGYGRALTGDVWYKDTVRVEYRLSF